MGYKIGLSQKRKQKLEAELQRIILEIIKLGVEKIILFGSLSSGDVHKSSDIDLIIVKKTEKKFLERLEEFYNYLNPQVAVDILVYTPEEFEEMKKNNPFIITALKHGRIIYERGSKIKIVSEPNKNMKEV
jgi:predicted nucleotidyltransferase